ncbi:SMI1/KNR4 family protein [Paenibacillus sp. GYB003]|uniref:SMI1/KNR4 family protein n=1 Tax=Paenibacillus sp. GYB003 TaxID=2994392 RepID=UPI002F968E09
MDPVLIDKLEQFFSSDGGEIYRGSPASQEQINDAERRLGVKFDNDYAEFLRRYGGSFAGAPIYGFNNSAMLEEVDVVELTMRFRADRWPEAAHSYVISMDMSGNPVMMDTDGKVFTYDHDSAETRTLSESFSAFLSDVL